VPVLSVATVHDRLSESIAEPRFYASLVATFAAVALVLAAVGLYGLLSYTVQQGVRDTAIRRALGAPAATIIGRVIAGGMAMVVAGLVVGLVASIALTRVLESMLYEIEPTDPRTLVMVVVVFLAVAFVAVWLPARRALRIDPMSVLRSE
jgi:putative ABC transport system permease protein